MNTLCPNPSCQKPLKENALFCGRCKTQVKCLDCKEPLSIDDECCESCGKDISKKKESNGAVNKLRIQETLEGRFIEAEFTDQAAKELTDTLGNFLIAKQLSLGTSNPSIISPNKKDDDSSNLDENIEVEIVNDTPPNIEKSSHPTLETVVMKNLPDSEPEWIIVYALYISDFGKKIFTRQDIIDSYQETKRRNASRINNLSTNIKSTVNSDFVNVLSENQFSLLDHGVKKALEIISRTSGTSSKSKTIKKVKEEKAAASTKVSGKGGGSLDELKMLDDLDLNPKNGQGLKDFVGLYKSSSNFERNLVYTYYLKEVLKLQEPVGYNHIYTCYRWLDEKFPNAFTQSIKDTKRSKQWLSYSKLTDIKISPKGMNHIKDLKI